MKFLTLLFALSTATLALGQDEMKRCEDFKENVLKPAVTYESEWKFVKDEATAKKFITDYDVSLLGIESNKVKFQSAKPECSKLKVSYCHNSINSFNYLSGLIYGMKNYGWNKELISLSKNRIWSYIDQTITVESSLLELAMAAKLLKVMAENQLVTRPTLTDIVQLQTDLDLASKKILTLAKGKKKPMSCKDSNEVMNREIQFVSEYTEKLRKML
jgi:hypothetical protein